METARQIREAVAAVSLLRQKGIAMPELADAVAQVKRFQARRFAGSYAALMASGAYRDATRFFLDELYSDRDYADRDAQFARIAGAIDRFFPDAVAQTAVALAQLHAVTEDLDQAMAMAWIAPQQQAMSPARRYASCWRLVGRRIEREQQLQVVLAIGDEMASLTRKPGLRMMLRMMRGPAAAAGLGALQEFLEKGFDTFSAMARSPGTAEEFLQTIGAREAGLIATLFNADLVACETQLELILGQAP